MVVRGSVTVMYNHRNNSDELPFI